MKRTTYHVFTSDGGKDISRYLPTDDHSHDDIYSAADSVQKYVGKHLFDGSPVKPMVILACDDGKYRLTTDGERHGYNTDEGITWGP